MKTLTKKVKKGFTIVELVIVIAVIAILAAVLIPTFSNVISAANESVYMQECRAEWSNYLPEVASETGFTTSTYYVAYDDSATTSTSAVDYSADYYFKVSNSAFNADTMYTVGTDDNIPSDYVAINYTYDYLNAKIKIYVPATSSVGTSETTAVTTAKSEAKTALGNALTANSSSIDSSYQSNYNVYASVYDGTSTYYFTLKYESPWTVTDTETDQSEYTSISGSGKSITETNSSYTVYVKAISTN